MHFSTHLPFNYLLKNKYFMRDLKERHKFALGNQRKKYYYLKNVKVHFILLVSHTFLLKNLICSCLLKWLAKRLDFLSCQTRNGYVNHAVYINSEIRQHPEN